MQQDHHPHLHVACAISIVFTSVRALKPPAAVVETCTEDNVVVKWPTETWPAVIGSQKQKINEVHAAGTATVYACAKLSRKNK